MTAGPSGSLPVKVVMAVTVAAVAGVAARVSFEHTVSVVSAAGEDTTTAELLPVTTDGLIVAAGLVLLDAARSGRRAPRLARFLLGLGIAATLGVNVLHGVAHGLVGAAVSAWPALAFTFTTELGLLLIRQSGRPVESDAAGTVSATPGGRALPTSSNLDEVVQPPAVATATTNWLPARMPARAAITPVGTVDRFVNAAANTEARLSTAFANRVAGIPRTPARRTRGPVATTPANTARRTREDFVNTAREALTPGTDVTAKWVMDVTGCGRTTATSIAAELRANRLRLAESSP